MPAERDVFNLNGRVKTGIFHVNKGAGSADEIYAANKKIIFALKKLLSSMQREVSP